MAIAAAYTRTAIDQHGDSPIDPANESGQSNLGRPVFTAELLQLGIAISEPTVSRYLQRLKRCDPSKAKRWLTFLNNHREVTAAFDFFTVPTLTFRVLDCFFVIASD